MSWEEYNRKKEEKAAAHRAKIKIKEEGARCKKCGWIGHACKCQIGLKEYKEFGGPIDVDEFARNNEIMRLKKLDKKGLLIDTLLKEG